LPGTLFRATFEDFRGLPAHPGCCDDWLYQSLEAWSMASDR
jgi:hypothetical protein